MPPSQNSPRTEWNYMVRYVHNENEVISQQEAILTLTSYLAWGTRDCVSGYDNALSECPLTKRNYYNKKGGSSQHGDILRL